jgi:uncharacterized protein YegP (UPF0339 family)
MKHTYDLTVYQDKAGLFRWRIRCSNGDKTADSGQGYSTRGNAIRAARRLQVIAADAKLVK